MLQICLLIYPKRSEFSMLETNKNSTMVFGESLTKVLRVEGSNSVVNFLKKRFPCIFLLRTEVVYEKVICYKVSPKALWVEESKSEISFNITIPFLKERVI